MPTKAELTAKLDDIEELVDIELDRLSQTDDLAVGWWEFGRKLFREGVLAERSVSAQKLLNIKEALDA